jgi:hypothetical protein
MLDDELALVRSELQKTAEAERDRILESLHDEHGVRKRVLGPRFASSRSNDTEDGDRFSMRRDGFVDATDASQQDAFGSEHFGANSRRELGHRRDLQRALARFDGSSDITEVAEDFGEDGVRFDFEGRLPGHSRSFGSSFRDR